MINFIILILISIAIFFFANRNKNNLLRKLSICLFVISVVLFALSNFGIISSKKSLEVNQSVVSLNDIVETISATGKIQPQTEIKISADVSGEIVELFVKEGDDVMKGDLLLKIKSDIYLSILERAEASLNSSLANLLMAEAQFKEIQQNFNRNKKLIESEVISIADFEKIESQYKVSKLNVESAKYAIISSEASVKEAKENLAKTKIYAPKNGTISRLNIEIGERVVGTAQMSGTEILSLANLNEMEVVVEVNENDILNVEIGDKVDIEVDALANQNFKGIVSEIANSADYVGISADQLTTFKVKIEIVDVANFKPGMTATVDIITARLDNVLSVPIESITLRYDSISDKKIECVFLILDDEVKKVNVKTGIQDIDFIQIKEGLSLNQKVVSGPYDVLNVRLNSQSKIEILD
ncbi:efflux RND transporter periplasmic adaptor subunit [Bacteroidota bacterium]|nr:efflux RND transporter periplasmic adaptor subunit [Bacteroidota bacterium]MDC3115716.1 efflux RND transporter periplasmic adaptor subunit [Bacteroidota bacterium]